MARRASVSKALAAALLAAVAFAASLPRADALWGHPGDGDGLFAKHFGGKFGMGQQQQQQPQPPPQATPAASPSPTTGGGGGSGTGCPSVIEARACVAPLPLAPAPGIEAAGTPRDALHARDA